MKKTNEFLYNLIPVTYRYKDNQPENQAALRAVMAYLQQEFDALHENIGTLRNNWFIETCEDWCIPYIADALGIDLTHPERYALPQRGKVANFIARQQYQGTLATIERAGFDTAKWYTKTIKFSDYIARTHSFHYHLPKMYQSHYLNLAELPVIYDKRIIKKSRYSADIRLQHKQNPYTLGFYTWRETVYQVVQMQCRMLSKRLFNIHALGIYSPLMTHSLTNSLNFKKFNDKNMPEQLTTDNFSDNYGPYDSFYIMYRQNNEQLCSISKDQILIAEIKNPMSLSQQDKVIIDLQQGKLFFPEKFPEPDEVFVNARYSFNESLGAGNYFRAIENYTQYDEDYTWCCHLAKESNISNKQNWDIPIYNDLQQAIEHWLTIKKDGLIIIDDNSIYSLANSDTLKELILTSDYSLTIIANQYNSPTIDITLPIKTKTNGQLILNGLFIHDTLNIEGLINLTIEHCSFNPELDHSLIMNDINSAEVTISSSIIGHSLIPKEAKKLTVTDSVIDGKNNIALSGNKEKNSYAANLYCERTTIRGKVYTQQAEQISNCILTEPLYTMKPEQGTISYSFVPLNSRIQNLVECQPQKVLATKLQTHMHQASDWLREQYSNQITATLTPHFISTQYGDINYMQLHTQTPKEILYGADNALELGAFNKYKKALRQKNYKQELDDYIPIEYSKKFIYIT